MRRGSDNNLFFIAEGNPQGTPCTVQVLRTKSVDDLTFNRAVWVVLDSNGQPIADHAANGSTQGLPNFVKRCNEFKDFYGLGGPHHGLRIHDTCTHPQGCFIEGDANGMVMSERERQYDPPSDRAFTCNVTVRKLGPLASAPSVQDAMASANPPLPDEASRGLRIEHRSVPYIDDNTVGFRMEYFLVYQVQVTVSLTNWKWSWVRYRGVCA